MKLNKSLLLSGEGISARMLKATLPKSLNPGRRRMAKRIIAPLLLLSAILIFPMSSYAAFSDKAVACWDFDSGLTDSVNHLNLTLKGDARISNLERAVGNGSVYFDESGDYLDLSAHPGQNIINLRETNFTICGWFRQTNDRHGAIFVHGGSADFSGINIQTVSAKKMDYMLSQDGSHWTGYMPMANSIQRDAWKHFCMTRDEARYDLYIDGKQAETRTLSPGPLYLPSTNMKIGIWYSGPSGMDFNGQIDNIQIWNRSLSPGEVSGDYNNGLGSNCSNMTASEPGFDFAPPKVTSIKTAGSAGSCESWNDDRNRVCATDSWTPALQFDTDENAFCAISGSRYRESDQSYTSMGSSRNCTGDRSGEGTGSHYCTLSYQDEIVYEDSYLFISCKDLMGNENAKSTSGPLKIRLSGLESNRRNAIIAGIRNSLGDGYLNYTDVQIYARSLRNERAGGAFDIAVKKSSRMWAFNGIGHSDQHVRMFNLPPVLYSMEFANSTLDSITSQVESLISSTQ